MIRGQNNPQKKVAWVTRPYMQILSHKLPTSFHARY